MTSHWYCLINEREHGPFTSQKIQRLAEKGKLKPEHSVRPETDSHWTPASAIPGLFPDAATNAVPPIAKAAPPKVARKPSPAGQEGSPTAQAVTVPQGIPVAVPPSATPIATPVAQPIATPVAQPVATPVGGVAIPPHAPATRHSSGDYAKRGRRKSQQMYIVVGSLVGVLVALGSVALFVIMKGPLKETPSGSRASTSPSTNADAQATHPEAADPELDPYQDSATAQDPAAVLTFPTLGRWLDATRQKGGLRGVAKLEVASAWTEKTAAGVRILNIDVKITNLAEDDSLDFRGWNRGKTNGVDTMALLSDEQGELLQPLPAEKLSGRDTATIRRITTDQPYTERLRFSLGDSTSGSFRLALPYASLGQTGYLGFEMPILMFKDHPPGAEPTDDSATPGLAEDDAAASRRGESNQPPAESPNRDGQAGVEEESNAVPDEFRSGSQPATIKDLLRSIEDGGDGAESTDGTLP